MDSEQITGHYTALAQAKQGIYPDGRTKIGQSLSCFRKWLRDPYGDNWNSLQAAREAIALPWLIFWLVCPMITKEGSILKDYIAASMHLERVIKDIADLGTKAPQSNIPSLNDWMKEQNRLKSEKDDAHTDKNIPTKRRRRAE